MKKSNRLAALALAAAMALPMTACGGKETPAPNKTDAPAAENTFTVGICQLAPHDALDAATRGFRAALEETMPGQVKFLEQNAGGDPNNCITIVDGFMAEGVDLIMANATASLTTAAAATDTVPILGTAVTNYGVALNLDSTEDKVLGGNISGTSDLAPLDQQAALLSELFPDAKNVGLLYCSAEPNSVFQIDTIQGFLTELGYTCTQFAFTDVNDLPSVAQSACDKSDVIYIPTDNTAANNTESIANVVLPAGVPVVAGEAGICSGCGVATLCINYETLGRITGEMAAQILSGEAKVSEMPIAFDTGVSKLYNAENCELLGITPPDGFEPLP